MSAQCDEIERLRAEHVETRAEILAVCAQRDALWEALRDLIGWANQHRPSKDCLCVMDNAANKRWCGLDEAITRATRACDGTGTLGGEPRKDGER